MFSYGLPVHTDTLSSVCMLDLGMLSSEYGNEVREQSNNKLPSRWCVEVDLVFHRRCIGWPLEHNYARHSLPLLSFEIVPALSSFSIRTCACRG